MINNFQEIWDEFPSAVTITDSDAKIIYMNKKSIETFANDGGEKLIGESLFGCHNPASNEIIRNILATGNPNTYTIEKKGKKKLIYQTPWFRDGIVAGLIELSIVLPENLPHFNRD